MKCEVIAVGTELLLGQIVDTNSSYIGEQLALAGIDSHFQVKVGDNADRMRSAIDLALSRSDAVILCGGLGPTQDDITRNVVADVMGVELETRQELVDKISAMFSQRGRQMPQNNSAPSHDSGWGQAHTDPTRDRTWSVLPHRRQGHLRRAWCAMGDDADDRWFRAP